MRESFFMLSSNSVIKNNYLTANYFHLTSYKPITYLQYLQEHPFLISFSKLSVSREIKKNERKWTGWVRFGKRSSA